MPSIQPVTINVNVGLKDFLRDIKTVEQAIANLEKLRTKSANNTAKAVTKAEKDALKATIDRVKQEERIKTQADKNEEKAQNKAVKDHERAEKAKTRITEREQRQQQQAYMRTANSIMAGIKRQAEEEARAIEAGNRARKRFADNVGRRFANGVTRGINAASGLATAAVGIMGGFGIADSVRDRANMHGLASQIAIQGSKTGGKQFQTGDVLGTATSEGIRNGRGTEETLKALGKFTDLTGDLDKGKEVLKTISDYADASGSSLTDMANAAGELFASGTITKAKELGTALGTYVEMGKSGAVELKDFAKGFAKITSTAGRFGGVSKMQNAFTLGAVGEINKAHGGAATPTQALTSIQSFGNDVANHFSKIQDSLGIKLRDKNGDMKSAQDIITDVTVASKGKAENLDHTFSAQSVRAINGPMETFRNAIKAGMNTEQARAAVVKELTDLSSKMLSEDKALEQATARRAEADKQFAIVTEKLKIAVGEQLLPEVLKLVPELTKLIPFIVDMTSALAKFVSWFSQNPFIGVGALIGAFLLKELAIAFAMAGLQGGVSKIVGGGIAVGGGANPPGGSGLGVGLGVVGAAAAAGSVAIGAAGNWDIRGNALSAADKQIEDSISGADRVTKAIFNPSKATSADMEAAKSKLAELNAESDRASKTNTGFLNSFGTGIAATAEGAAGVFGYSGHSMRDQAGQIVKDREIQESKELSGAIKVLTAVIEKTGQAMGGMDDYSGDAGRGNREAPIAQRGGSNGR
jgi:hypothetical protein